MTDQPDRCDRCRCDDCGGLLTEHAQGICRCQDCAASPEYACTAFLPSGRIALLAEQMAPLLSPWLNDRAARRCLHVAHAAHHAFLDYDHHGDTR